MLLCDSSLLGRVDDDRLVDPYNPELLQPASYDLTLDVTFVRYAVSRDRVSQGPYIDVDARELNGVDAVRFVSHEPFIMDPGCFILGSTKERIHIPDNCAGRFEGKSTLGRFGLATHITAGFVDPGFEGTLTLEMKNNNNMPLLITPGMRIGQLCLYRMDFAPDVPYGDSELGSHYQHQSGPTIPRP